MDSTKKVVRKLAGHSTGTASWASNVGNEFGQVLMSVLTAGEGHGLGPMAQGLIQRYADAGVSPPGLLYTDRYCCGASIVQRLFSDCPELTVCLDILHFMRRIASTCTTVCHPLYGTFLRRLSHCIFQWSEVDMNLLKFSKNAEMVAKHVKKPTYAEVLYHITKKEMDLHCRRKTRGVEETTRMIHDLLTTFSGPQGSDATAVPLLDVDKVWEMWKSQKRHVHCIQDPPGVQLYTLLQRTVTKGGVQLPVSRCERGSTSRDEC